MIKSVLAATVLTAGLCGYAIAQETTTGAPAGGAPQTQEPAPMMHHHVHHHHHMHHMHHMHHTHHMHHMHHEMAPPAEGGAPAGAPPAGGAPAPAQPQ